MSVIFAFLIALVVASVVVTAECKIEDTTIVKLSFDNWMKALTIGTVVGVAHFLIGGANLFLAVVSLIAVIAVVCYLVYWWHQEGSELKEMWPFAVVMLPIFLVLKAVAAKVAEIIDHPFWGSVVNAIPTIVVLVAAGLIVADFFHFRYTEMDSETTEAGAREMQLHRIGAVTAVVLTAVMVGGVVYSAIDWSAISGPEAVYGDGSTTTNENGWVFYNLKLQDDGDEDNDFNFGPKASGSAEELDEIFRQRVVEDPALGAADMAWLDAIVGTRYLGEFYESCKGDWAKTINLSKESFIQDPVLYARTREAFFQYLDKASVSVETATGLTDQMYMNPYTEDGIPDIIVLKTKNHTGRFLVYTFKIKGNTFKVAYRLECGFQPTNVESVMGIKPQGTPKKPGKPGGRGDGGTPKKPGKPGKGENSTPKYNKDPSKAPKKNTEPNDDKGPGENTNNPSDPQHSTKDTPDSSTSGSYEDYRENIKKLEEANKNQKKGGDSNTPTKKPEPGTNVDNNGDKGTGHGGADTPTPVKEKPKEAGSGKPIDNKPGEAWEGPSD